jgi:Transglycosylase SLT domain
VAGQSITFDFLSRGAASLSRDFRSIGDDSALGSRGVKILSDVIERLGSKENRTAAESKLLAGALRQTGEAADRATAKAVLADAAIRRLGDAEQEAAKKSDGLSKSLGGLKLNPGLAGPALALLPALGTLGGVVAGVGAGLAGAFVAGGGAIAAFGAVAKPVLTDAMKASQAVQKAQDNYSIAIANGTKQSVAYKAEQTAIAKAYANLSPAQIALSQQIGAMAKSWDAVKAAQTPVIAGALQPWLKSVTGLTAALGPIIAAVSPVIKALGGQFDALVNSAAFKGFRDFIAGTGSRVVGAAGGTIIDLVKSFLILLPKFNPLILQMTGGIAAIGPAVLKWASSQKTADQITAFMGWFTKNGPVVGGLLTNLGGALKALAPGLTSGGTAELKIISDFLGFVAKLPPAFAKPITEVVGSLLILSKLGVLKVGVQIVGAAAKWLTGGLVSLGGGASAGAEIRAAMVSGGTAAAAEIRAAMTGGGAAAGAEGAAGGAAKGAAAGGIAAVGAAAGVVVAGAFAGALIRAVGDTLSPRGTFAGKLNANLQSIASTSGGIFSTNLLHSFTFGGLEAWLTAKIGLPFGRVLNDIGAGARIWSGNTTGLFTRTWSGILGGARIWGQNIAGIFTQTIPAAARTGLSAISSAWNATWNTLKAAFRVFVVDGILTPLGWIIDGAAKAFGWVPGLGGKLQGAARAFAKFKDDVNTALGGINGRTVNVSVAMTSSTNPYPGGISGRKAAGGRITGPGGPRDDIAGLYALSNGEWVIRADSAARYGLAAMDAVNRGKAVIRYASGGPVGVNVQAVTPGYKTVESALMASVTKLAAAFAKAAQAAQAAAGGGPGGPGGGSGVARWAGVILQALSLIGQPASWLNTVERRMNQESGGNPTIVNKWDSNWLAGHPSVGLMQVIAGTFARYAGRFRNTGPFEYGVSVNPLANTYAGLNYAVGTYGSLSALNRPGGYDRGGWLMPGVTVAHNNTGRPEMVIPGGGLDGLAAELRALRGQMAELIRTTAAVPAATGRHVGGAISGAGADAAFRRRYPGR